MKFVATCIVVICVAAAKVQAFLPNENPRYVGTVSSTTTTTTALPSFFPGANFDATGRRREGGYDDRERGAVGTAARVSPQPQPVVSAPTRRPASTTRTYDDSRFSEMLAPPSRAMPLARPAISGGRLSRIVEPPLQPNRAPLVQQQRPRRAPVERSSEYGRGLSLQDLGSLQDFRSRSVLSPTLYEQAVEVDTVTDLTTVQGGSLRTWSFPNPKINSVQVFLKTEGRPLNSIVELWNGPDNTPVKCAVYLEDGDERAFSAIFATPRSSSTNSLSVKNTSPMAFPIEAAVEANHKPIHRFVEECMSRDVATHKKLQGGSVCTVPLPPSVQSAAVLMRTEGRPLNARLELMQGPSNNKQVLEIYSENGLERPFFTIVETPGQIGTVIRVVNAGAVEFPVTVNIQPYAVDPGMYFDEDSWRRRYTPDDFFFAM